MDFYILNREEKICGVFSNKGESSFLKSAILKEGINQMHTLEIEASSIGIEIMECREENYILFKDNFQNWRCFIIKEVSEIHGYDFTKTIYSEDSSQELIDFVIETEYAEQELTPSELLSRILYRTRWEIGNIDTMPAVRFPEKLNNKSVLEGIHAIADAFNLQIRFRISVAGNRIIGRYVDLVKSIGNNYGKRFEYTKDLVQIERTVQSSDLKTAIIPIGGKPLKNEDEDIEFKDCFLQAINENEVEDNLPINIKGIEWKKPLNPVNKPLGQHYLEISEATEQWGYYDFKTETKKPRFIFYENNQIIDPEELISEAYKVLFDISKPTINYKLDAIDLYELTKDENLSFESVKLGDIVSVVDRTFNPPILLKTSIISKEVDLLDSSNTKIELGSVIRNLVDSNASQNNKDMIQGMIDGVLDVGLSELEGKVIDVSKEFHDFKKVYSSIELNYNWIKNSDFSNSLKQYSWWNNSDIKIEKVSEIPFFSSAATATKGNFTQIIEGGIQLLDNNVTLSAFVYGQGVLSIEIHYNDSLGNAQIKQIDSDIIPIHDGWGRYSLTASIKKNSNMFEATAIYVSFIAHELGYWTGLQFNLGTAPSKYMKNPSDKYGKGVYDQIKEISNETFKNGLGYVYLEEEDGLWVYDKPTSGKPTKMTALKGGMLGIGHWNLQTQQWDIKTFIDGNYVNASCINAGSLNADLIRTGKLQSVDGSVQINMENGRFSLGVGGDGSTTQLTNESFKISYTDGSYTQMDGDGFKWYKAGNSRAYHCLASTIGFTGSGDPESDIIVNLPPEFRGKSFTAQAVLSDTYEYSWDHSEPWVLQRMVAFVSSINYEEATVTIKGYRTDKNYKTDAIRRHKIAGILIVIA